jgi:hypothetical protein
MHLAAADQWRQYQDAFGYAQTRLRGSTTLLLVPRAEDSDTTGYDKGNVRS